MCPESRLKNRLNFNLSSLYFNEVASKYFTGQDKGEERKWKIFVILNLFLYIIVVIIIWSHSSSIVFSTIGRLSICLASVFHSFSLSQSVMVSICLSSYSPSIIIEFIFAFLFVLPSVQLLFLSIDMSIQMSPWVWSFVLLFPNHSTTLVSKKAFLNGFFNFPFKLCHFPFVHPYIFSRFIHFILPSICHFDHTFIYQSILTERSG